MLIKSTIKKSLILCLIISLLLGSKVFAFDCLAPKISIVQSGIKQELDKQIFLRDVIKTNLSFVLNGACRIYSINLSALLFIAGIKSWIVVDENHVWVETKEYILDAYMQSNFKFIKMKRLNPEVYAQWKNTGGVIAKQSNFAKKFYLGKAVKIKDSEFKEMLGDEKNGFVAVYRGNVPISVDRRITSSIGTFIYEQAMEKQAKENLIARLRDVVPWSTITRYAAYTEATLNDEYHLKYWLNQYDMRIYMQDVLASNHIEKLTLEEFKIILKRAHRYAAAGRDNNRTYKLKPRIYGKEREIELGGEFRSRIARSAETNSFYDYHVKVLETAEKILNKYQVKDPFIDNAMRNDKIILKGIPESALPDYQFYNPFEDPYSAYIDNNHPYWDNADYYFSLMLESFKKAYANIDTPKELIKNLAEFYQYSINIMPFESINNSFFMNIVNMFLEQGNLKAIRHGFIDFAAFDLQQETFLLFFYDRVLEANPVLSNSPLLTSILSKDLMFTDQLKIFEASI